MLFRYLSYVMDVATPTTHCLNVVFDLFSPVIMKRNDMLSSLENRLLVLLSDRIEELIASIFENYKSLDESSPSGLQNLDAYLLLLNLPKNYTRFCTTSSLQKHKDSYMNIFSRVKDGVDAKALFDGFHS